MITDLAYNALIKEVELTPKPGLVDRTNNGSHTDMNIDTFYVSAKAIKPFISEFLKQDDFESLREVGKRCEIEMFKATEGVNTHKGMIFSLAIVCGAINRAKSFEFLQEEIKFLCKNLVKNDLEKSLHVTTHGEKFFKEFKHTGIRGEAQSGYTTVFEKALPFYDKQLNNYGEESAMKLTLLFLMSLTDDSTLFARGGLDAIEFVKKEAKKILHVENLDNNLLELDKMMIERNLSSGGSADLLGLTWFLYQLKGQKWNF